MTLVAILSLAIAVFFILISVRNDNKRITWIENEFYKQENAKRTAGITGEVRSMQKDGSQG